MFYKDEHFQSTMQQLLLEVTLYNFQLFEQTPENQFSDIADLIEAFYGFNAQIVKKISSAYTDVNIDCNKLVLYGKFFFLTFFKICFFGFFVEVLITWCPRAEMML